MSSKYPALGIMLFNVLVPCAFTDVICEITFSHSKSTKRQNSSDGRHDDDMRWMHNILTDLRKERYDEEQNRRTKKGLLRQIKPGDTKTSRTCCETVDKNNPTLATFEDAEARTIKQDSFQHHSAKILCIPTAFYGI